MGCDMHLYVEQRQGDGTWAVLSGPNPRIKYYRALAERARTRGTQADTLEADAKAIESGAAQHDPDDDYNAPVVFKDWLWDGRSYNLFAILANVRNGHGFAGVKTGEGFTPIAPPRDLPGDVTAYVDEQAAAWGIDGHSHSYHTLADLLAYDWETQTTVHHGVVDQHEYTQYKETGSPRSWCGAVDGSQVRNITPEQMDALLAGEFPREADADYYTAITWAESYRAAAGSFATDAIPRLQALAGDDPTSVRIVFWFDN